MQNHQLFKYFGQFHKKTLFKKTNGTTQNVLAIKLRSQFSPANILLLNIKTVEYRGDTVAYLEINRFSPRRKVGIDCVAKNGERIKYPP